MGEKKATPLEAVPGQPLHPAHLKRLIDSTVKHSQATVAIEYPDPNSVDESELTDPRDDAALPSARSARKSRRTKTRPETGAEGDK